jgi:hypothetical protein
MDTCPHHSGIEAELRGICAKMELRFKGLDKEIDTAKREMDRRLEGMNEFRAQLDRQAKDFIGRTEMKLEIERLVTRIVSLEKAVNYGQGSKYWSNHILTVFITAVVMLAMHYLFKVG